MSRLYLQKGGIDHFTDNGVGLDNKSYTSTFAGYTKYELSNTFFAPDNKIVFNKELSGMDTITFSIERFDTPQLILPATTIEVSVIQYNNKEVEVSSVNYILCDGDKLYYELEPPTEGAIKAVITITNWSRAYHHNTNGKATIYVGGLS